MKLKRHSFLLYVIPTLCSFQIFLLPCTRERSSLLDSFLYGLFFSSEFYNECGGLRLTSGVFLNCSKEDSLSIIQSSPMGQTSHPACLGQSHIPTSIVHELKQAAMLIGVLSGFMGSRLWSSFLPDKHPTFLKVKCLQSSMAHIFAKKIFLVTYTQEHKKTSFFLFQHIKSTIKERLLFLLNVEENFH